MCFGHHKLKYTTPMIDYGSKCTVYLRWKKDTTYKFELYSKWEIAGAKCKFPVGKRLAATCKHIGPLCYLFQSFYKNGTVPEFLTCPQYQQEWSQLRQRKLDARPVIDLKEHKIISQF